MNFITNQVEKKLGVDLNRDGMIGSSQGSDDRRPSGNGGGGLINQIESATHMDLNHDGSVGGKPAYPSNSNQYGCGPYPGPPNQYGGAGYAPNTHQSSGGGSMNQLEKVTHTDLNGDGRIGGGSAQHSNYNHQGHQDHHGHQAHQGHRH